VSYVKLEHVTKRFGKVTAVSDLNIDIEQGECFSMLGPSGCGKTTTLRMVAGFEDLDEGEISVGGRLLSSSVKKYYLPPEKRNFGMVFQAFAVWPHLNVFDNVAFPLQIRGLSRTEIAERTRKAILHTGLEKYETAYPNEISGGQKQRIALARAIAINPSVMLLDEPLSNLDPKLREEMRFEIKDLQRKFGFTIIFGSNGAVRPYSGDARWGRTTGWYAPGHLYQAREPFYLQLHWTLELSPRYCRRWRYLCRKFRGLRPCHLRPALQSASRSANNSRL